MKGSGLAKIAPGVDLGAGLYQSRNNRGVIYDAGNVQGGLVPTVSCIGVGANLDQYGNGIEIIVCDGQMKRG